jgi:membrane associated rhomboid family serine protease
MLIPLTHERMTVQHLPWVTIGIIAMNFVVFAFTWPTAQRDETRRADAWEDLITHADAYPGVWEEDCTRCPGRAEFDALRERFEAVASEHIFSRYGYVPGKPTLRGLFGSLFLHAGWAHLLWNMYFLWLYGCSIEDLWGRPLYGVVYLTGGVAAALAQGAYEPDTLGPLVGASGAISALTGVFLIRCWDTRIRFFWMFIVLFGTFQAPAWIMLGFWLTKELFNAFVYADVSSVAFWAHIGGFVFGAVIASVLKLTRVEENILAPALDRKTNLPGRHPEAARAVELMEDGDYSTATRALKTAIQQAPKDSDSYRLLAQCYQARGRPEEATRWLRQELKLHTQARDDVLVAETYQELVNTAPELSLTPRELWSVATSLMATGNEGLGVPLYIQLLEDAPEPMMRLSAGLALVEHYQGESNPLRGLEILDHIQELAAPHDEWRTIVENKRAVLREAAPAFLRR